MAEANPTENLELLIGEVCTKISSISKRETDINKNSTSEIDLVEKDVLLRRNVYELNDENFKNN